MTDVEALEGEAGHFRATLRERPRYIAMDKCIACGMCALKCPRKVDDEFNEGLSKRKAAYLQYPQAVPLKYVIDPEHCIYFEKGKCRACEKACQADAIDFGQREKVHELEIGAVILAAGSQPFDPRPYEHYGYGKFPDVITSMELERILSASGPSVGHLVRPSDGRSPRKIAWLQCVGSRGISSHAHTYCSGVCCMYSIKQAVIAKEHAGKDLDTAIFFMDMRTCGKEFERYQNRASKELNVRFIRSRPHSVEVAGPGSDDLAILYADPSGQIKKERFDLVVLSVGLESSTEAQELAQKLGIMLDSDRFVQTGCLKPVETSRPGVFVCGTFGGPMDIPQSVTQASAAASACAALLSESRNALIKEKIYPPEVPVSQEEPRIGVFVCHCGINIAGVVDVPAVRDYARTLPGVVYATDHMFTCSQDTQQLIQEAIKEYALNRVTVAACTPRTHESLFQDTIRGAGLNRYLLEFANIRDQDAWVHQDDPNEATQKAKDLVRMAVAKVALSEPISEIEVEVNQKALVIGGGVAGMTAALSLADEGFKAYLIEQDAKLGGHALKVRQTWKGEDVQAYVRDLCERVERHSRVQVLPGAQIIDVKGFVGNFSTTVEANGAREEIHHGVAILATGARALETEDYLYGQTDRVTRWHELEDLFEKKPECFEQAEAVAFINCVGSREPERPYCSKICCTASIQQAIALKRKKPSLDVYILYRDLRTYGQRESLYRKARELGVFFIRYASEEKPLVEKSVLGGKDKLQITVKDQTLGIPLRLYADYLNLFTAIIPREQQPLARLFKVPLDKDGFFLEAHMKLRPVDFSTDGLFVCGTAHYPKPIEETIVQAQAAAARATCVLNQKVLQVEPLVSVVDQEKCIGCGLCEASCPFDAIRLSRIDKGGYKAQNIPALCKGCGICASGCPEKAIDMVHFRDREIFAAIQVGGENAMDIKGLAGPRREPLVHVVNGYRLADGYYYHAGHSWAHPEKGGRVKIGLDDFIVKVLGLPRHLRLPSRGSTVRQDHIGWIWTRNGQQARVLCPITGKVFALNPKVAEDPEIILEDPYEEGWLFILEPSVPRLDLRRLYYGERTDHWMEGENKKLSELFGPDYERLAATGGEPITDLFGHFPEIGWDNLVKTFLHT